MSKPHQRAATKALQTLKHLHIEQYRALYRAEVVANGGRVHPSKADKIARLKAELARLESKRV
jgi:hypothetical protein